MWFFLLSCSSLDEGYFNTSGQKGLSVKEVIGKNRSSFQQCLPVNKPFEGLLEFSWIVISDGSVKNVKLLRSDLKNKKLENCFKRNIEKLKFETFGLNYSAQIKKYTFVFKKTKRVFFKK